MVLPADGTDQLPRTPGMGHPEWVPPAVRIRPLMANGPRETPWAAPTRITGAGGPWKVDYGETQALEPGISQDYPDGASLLADLDRIEWWPMTVEEARRIQEERVLGVATAWARNDHYLACPVTEPYGSRMDEISAQRKRLREQRPLGNIDAQYLLVDAEAWASAVRTARAGGPEWGENS